MSLSSEAVAIFRLFSVHARSDRPCAAQQREHSFARTLERSIGRSLKFEGSTNVRQPLCTAQPNREGSFARTREKSVRNSAFEGSANELSLERSKVLCTTNTFKTAAWERATTTVDSGGPERNRGKISHAYYYYCFILAKISKQYSSLPNLDKCFLELTRNERTHNGLPMYISATIMLRPSRQKKSARAVSVEEARLCKVSTKLPDSEPCLSDANVCEHLCVAGEGVDELAVAGLPYLNGLVGGWLTVGTQTHTQKKRNT